MRSPIVKTVIILVLALSALPAFAMVFQWDFGSNGSASLKSLREECFLTPESYYSLDEDIDIYRSRLSQDLASDYDRIERSMRSLSSRAALPYPVSRGESIELVKMVLCDNPDIFWVDRSHTCFSNDDGSVNAIKFNYLYDRPGEIRSRYEMYMRNAQKYASAIKAKAARRGENQREEAYQAYKSVMSALSYGHDGHDQNVDAFLGEADKAVCAGYAKSFQIICSMLGIRCVYVTGHVSGDAEFPHAWNVCCLDGRIYYVDATWGDACGSSVRQCFTTNRDKFKMKHRGEDMDGIEDFLLDFDTEDT